MHYVFTLTDCLLLDSICFRYKFKVIPIKPTQDKSTRKQRFCEHLTKTEKQTINSQAKSIKMNTTGCFSFICFN